MSYLIVNVFEESEAVSPAYFLDGCVIITMDFESHGASLLKRVGAKKVRIYALLV